jgi:hypothetical protein
MRLARKRRQHDAVVHRAIGEFTVSLCGDLPGALADFADLYPPAHESIAPSDRTIEIEIRRAGRTRFGRRRYQVIADGVEIGSPRPAEAVFPFVEWGINLRIMATRSEFLQFHAASMAYRGRGFIFAGDSGRGKSTLAAILLANGWSYLCDEFALVDPGSTELRPFPKALCIKQGSYPVLRRLGVRFARRCDYIKGIKGRVAYVDPRAAGVGAIGGPAPVRFLVFPTYEEGAHAALTPISRGRAAVALYRSCFNREAFAESALPAITALVSSCECFRLTVGKPEATVRLLESVAGVGDGAAIPIAADGCTRSGAESTEQTPLPNGRGTDLASARPRRLTLDIASRRKGRASAARCSHGTDRAGPRLASRRDVLRAGAKLAYVAPAVLTLSAGDAFAAISNPSAFCSTALHSGELCETDSDCCSKNCDFGVCE